MGLSASTWWWIVTGLLVAAELATGTFYLLMLAIGAAAAALAAGLGFGLAMQLIAAALVGGGAVAVWRARRQSRPAEVAPQRNRDINLDIGQRVLVEAWSAERCARVLYRGSAWNVRYVGNGVPLPGEHVISAVEGSELLVERVAVG